MSAARHEQQESGDDDRRLQGKRSRHAPPQAEAYSDRIRPCERQLRLVNESIEEPMREYGRRCQRGDAPLCCAEPGIPEEPCRSCDDRPREAGHQTV